MLDKATAYIATNPNIILWALILLTVAVIYLYYTAYISEGLSTRNSKKSRRRRAKKRSDDEDAIEDGDLPEPDDASAKISRDRIAELELL